MIDPRIYRAGIVPLLLALVVAAFSVQTPPRPLTAGLPPDSFDGARGFTGLLELARLAPAPVPGGPGDRALAARVRDELAAPGRGYRVQTRRFEAATPSGTRELDVVMGERIGQSSRRIVVVADRSSLARPAAGELSGTAALLELARVFEGRTLRKSLLLVSTSGGGASAPTVAEMVDRPGAPADAVIVLGDLAAARTRQPIVVPWSQGDEIAPFDLRATLGAAVRQETGLTGGQPRAAAQFARLAVPLTAGQQGDLLELGLPAVLLSAAGERSASARDGVSRVRFEAFGRSALRAITALDARAVGSSRPRAELYVAGKVVPGWALRLLIGVLILPGLLAAVDGFARVRRRGEAVGPWIGWVAAGALPFAAALGFAWLLSVVGLLPGADTAAPGGVFPLGIGGAAALAAVLAAGVAAWRWLRPAALRLAGVRGDPGGAPGAGAALALVLAAAVASAWVFNPFAAALLLPALHAWIVLAAPEVQVHRTVALVVIALTLLPLGLLALYYALVLGLDPPQLLWNAVLLATRGDAGLLGALSWAVVLGCLAAILAIALSRRFEPPAPGGPRIRGPVTYAGPGSLGGTESALRR